LVPQESSRFVRLIHERQSRLKQAALLLWLRSRSANNKSRRGDGRHRSSLQREVVAESYEIATGRPASLRSDERDNELLSRAKGMKACGTGQPAGIDPSCSLVGYLRLSLRSL